MNKCQNCGNPLKSGMTFCNNCGSKVEVQKEDKPKQTNKPIDNNYGNGNNNNKKKIFIIAGVVCLVVVVGLLLGRKSLMYNYYIFKGNNQNEITKSVDYYEKALKVKYNKDAIDKINSKTMKTKDFEHILYNLQDVITPEDLNTLYANAYVYRAKENFEHDNHEAALGYLKKAEEHGYNIQDFEYYNQLEKEDKENTNNDSKDYIIADSSTRYLTKEDLSKYSKKQLAYIRNEIFARNGYIFDTDAYSNYFYGKSWYKPNPEFGGNESELNDVEKANVALIKKLEGNNKDESTNSKSSSHDKKQIYLDKLAQLEKEEEGVHNEYNYGELCDADYVTETTKVYEDYDKVLNEIYQDLNATLPSDTMNDLRDIQRNWVKDKEAKQKEIEKNETGMHVNWMIIGRNGALTQMVKERCYELLNYFN